jgi:hypothetical protein
VISKAILELLIDLESRRRNCRKIESSLAARTLQGLFFAVRAKVLRGANEYVRTVACLPKHKVAQNTQQTAHFTCVVAVIYVAVFRVGWKSVSTDGARATLLGGHAFKF